MTTLTTEKKTALLWLNEHTDDISDWHQLIWNYAEPVWREYKSAKWYVELLRAEGFDVEEQSGDMETAFCATFTLGTGGPVIGAYAEYDAVPGNSQQAVPYQAPREGVHDSAPGHTDPHSALGMGGLAGVLATKAAMEKHNIAGTIKFFGEPAEKVCGSKPIHAAKGYYNHVDAFISFHPAYKLPLSNTVRWETHCGSSYGRVFTFKSKPSELWGRSTDRILMPVPHTTSRAPGANDALCLMYTTVKYLKEAMLPHSGGWFMGEAILMGGQATADNMAPDMSQIYYCWRAPTLAMQERIAEVLEKAARDVAETTHCTVEGAWVQKNRPGLANKTLATTTYQNLELAGPPVFCEKAKQFGRDILENLGFAAVDNPFMPEAENLIDPQEAEKILREDLPPWQKNSTTDDYVEYTWHAPTVRLYIGRCMVEQPKESEHVLPMWVWNALGGKRECIDPTIMAAARTISYTMIDLFTRPESLAAARSEFIERTGGGVGGSKWLAPLFDKHIIPPSYFRWPEYVTTVRGEEWWVPTLPGNL